jgi:Ca-activated chloride channel family protein
MYSVILVQASFHVKRSHKKPDAEKSILIEQVITGKSQRPLTETSGEFRFAVAVAGFGQLLRGNTHIGTWQYEDTRKLAATAVGKDPYGYRSEFLKLVSLAESLARAK